jgi:hypothetical protein
VYAVAKIYAVLCHIWFLWMTKLDVSMVLWFWSHWVTRSVKCGHSHTRRGCCIGPVFTIQVHRDRPEENDRLPREEAYSFGILFGSNLLMRMVVGPTKAPMSICLRVFLPSQAYPEHEGFSIVAVLFDCNTERFNFSLETLLFAFGCSYVCQGGQYRMLIHRMYRLFAFGRRWCVSTPCL